MTNERAQAWLESLGFQVESEPRWITSGEKPDFLATGPARMWVEVKTLETEYELGDALNDLRLRCERLRKPGKGLLDAVVNDYDSKMGQVAIALANKAASAPPGNHVHIVMIPGDPAYGTDVLLEYECRTGEIVRQIGPASVSGTYQCYPSLEPKDSSALVGLEMSDGTSCTAPMYRHLYGRVPLSLALRLFPAESPLSAGSGSGGVHSNPAPKRIRAAITKANSQIRNAERFAAAPGLVNIYHDGMDALGVEMFFAALFGDMTLPVTGHPPRAGQAYFGASAALTTGQNRGVGAVRYYPHKGEPHTVVNPYAETPIDWRQFADAAWILTGDQFVLTSR